MGYGERRRHKPSLPQCLTILTVYATNLRNKLMQPFYATSLRN